MTDEGELDDAQLEALQLNDPVERAKFAGHLELMSTARKFLETAVRDGDLRAVWGLVHDSLRTELARQWVADNRGDIRASGFDEEAVVAALA
jgi:hypothetical protein